MKFKFRADTKDIIYFVIFAVFLLYLVAIAILNLASLAQRTTFYGWNPIEAFSPQFIGPTLIFYILSLVGIIVSVSSYFWDKEKGFGFQTGKPEKSDYSRWAKDEEIKTKLKEVNVSQPTLPYAGIPLLVKGKRVWVDDSEAHTLIMGSTGSGKTTRLINPLIKILAKKGESMILTDPKGELYEENSTMLMAKGYNIVLLNLRNPEKGNAWNPLTLPYQLYKEESDKANELLADLAISLLHDDKTDDPFWQNSSADYFTGLALGLFEDAKEEEINLNSISYMSAAGEEKYGGSVYAKEYFSSKDPSKPIYINASGTINAPQDTKNSILSVFRQKIKIFATTEHLSEMLSYSDFDMKDIGRRKTAVFIIIQDEKKTYHALATIFIKQCYETLIDVAQDNNGKLPIRTNFILDEFANMPPLRDVTTMITAARSRQIRFNLVIQNFSQLNQVYGADDAETIKGNCANLVYLMSKELKALEEISKLCGEKKVKGKGDKDPDKDKPLISISELQRLKMGDAIIIKDRSYPLKTKLPGMWEYDFNEPKSTQINYPVRQKRIVKLFDIKEFVNNQRMNAYPNGNVFSPNMFDPRFAGGMNSAMGNTDPSQFLPPNNQLGKHNLDATPQPNAGYNQNFFSNRNKANMFNGDDSFNVDDLIKKIDAKIAELEAEEKREEENNAAATNASANRTQAEPTKPQFVPTPPVNPVIEDIKPVEPMAVEQKPVVTNPQFIEPEVEEEETIVNINPDIDKIMNSTYEDENTDDQFFDDFFSDDDE
ncbi:MAG: type IV secretory system conjugative DNA transfer family protein [Bacilli bacterium]|nr:type IV secretory system conjugative DNA transfer family protein [Bacilli bacterium]MDD3305403.1 type IV secretory system conjugative DNA transfer family protein [Bacilli bacterium]MDD4053341.1 type IV secretory system conjugative DNA transfer family protein [Bacilli bacterium]MDD4411012.1 type IV secretory system conjugative DNA transfer family protein [Bacilli bacterium]